MKAKDIATMNDKEVTYHLTITVSLPDEERGSKEETQQLNEFERSLGKAVVDANVGVPGGHLGGDNDFHFFLKGLSAAEIHAAVEPIIVSSRYRETAVVKARYKVAKYPEELDRLFRHFNKN